MKSIFVFFICVTISCTAQEKYKPIGIIERLDGSINDILSPNAKAEIIAEGFEWSEGPLWIENNNMLLFSDIPRNAIYKWTETNGAELYLQLAGYTGQVKRVG